MRLFELRTADGPRGWVLSERDIPQPKPGEVLIKVKATSLNYRDLMFSRNPRQPFPRVPLSDGAGEVAALGEGVTKFAIGDRVAANFFANWVAGEISADAHNSALGGAIDGMLAEYVALPEHAFVKIPDALSFEEAATLPCAAVTVWNALFETGRLTAGETVLLLGTGGVSIFALQFAKMAGAKVILTSSSDEKLARGTAMGADAVVNYKTTPDWDKAVWELTDKRGVDHVVEVGGAGTLEKSLKSTRYGGTVSVIGILTGFGGQIDPFLILGRSIHANGIYVGSRTMFERMLAAITQNKIQPVIDRVFDFEAAPEALSYLESGTHFGKIVIRVGA